MLMKFWKKMQHWNFGFYLATYWRQEILRTVEQPCASYEGFSSIEFASQQIWFSGISLIVRINVIKMHEQVFRHFLL
jgi:hypothetical protein